MGRVDFVPKTEGDKLTRFYVPMEEWDGEYYPPDEYTGTAVMLKDAFIYAITHIDGRKLDEYAEWYGSDDAFTDTEAFEEFYYEDWLIVTYEEMCPDMDDFYDPKDTGHGYWDFY